MTSMNELGEKHFLRALLPTLRRADCFVNGFGHDVSILDLGLDMNIAFKIDRAPSPISVTNAWSDYKVWGRLAVVANVSDLIAAAATPKALMLSIVVPGSIDRQHVEEIVAGCVESCRDHGLAFLGGDTKEGPSIQIVGACIGTSNKQYYLGRDIAKPGDHLVVAGMLGEFLGAYILLKEGLIEDQMDRANLIDILAHPKARIDEGRYIADTHLASASCDLSDGIADALSHFCNNNIGITIDEARLPIHPLGYRAAEKTSREPYRLAFGVGDWAVAFVVPSEMMGVLQAGVDRGLQFSSIGRFDDSGKKLIKRVNGQVETAPEFVNEQFSMRLEDEKNYLDLI
jgi:thiamine-monophosphate kinase